MSDAIYGPVVIDSEIGAAVQSTLQTWYPDRLAFVTRQLATMGVDIGYLPEPRSYVISSDPNHFPEEQLPAVLIAVPGTVGRPVRDGFVYRAYWEVRVTVFVDSTQRETTEALAKYYSAATRMIMTQQPSLSEFANGTEWCGTSYSIKVEDNMQRTMGSAENRFEVDVRDVVTAFAGPSVPSTNVPADWPTANTVKTIFTVDPS